MKGAIIGDIIGSIYEFDNFKGNIDTLELLGKYNFYTDDTICTCGIAKAAMCKDSPTPVDYAKHLWTICNKYPDCSYGVNFNKWVSQNPPRPYNSYGNGAAMRISSIPYLFKKRDIMRQVKYATIISHGHPEGILGAQVVAQIINYGIQKLNKEDIKEYVKDIYNLPPIVKIDFDETCQGTVPICISILLNSNSFDEAMRKSVWVGGDTDTICAIVGSMAEPLFGIPQNIEEKMWSYLDDNLIKIIKKFELKNELKEKI